MSNSPLICPRVSWNQIDFPHSVNSYGLNGMGIESVELFHQTPRDLLNSWIYVCVLNACSHSGLVDQAHQIFATIPIEEKTERIYTTMVR